MERIAFEKQWMFGRAGEQKRFLDLPHDAMLEQERSSSAETGRSGAFFRGGDYEYEKSFMAPEEWENQDIFIEFEGIYPHAVIELNGQKIGECHYGYTGYFFLLEGLQYGRSNTISVRVDGSRQPDSRWYSGTGIYRPVFLWTGNKKHIMPEGVRVTTLSHDPAVIRVDIKCSEAVSLQKDQIKLVTEIYEKGQKVAVTSGNNAVITLENAKLWSDRSPSLYECRCILTENGMVLDEQRVSFGIRTLEWSAERGFEVNGETVLLRGGCIHHDHGILGAASYEKAERRRLKKLKECGFNAIRSAHNPICKTALDVCDELGIYVMDEGWDMWYKSKSRYDYADRFEEHFEDDIRMMTEKDYNHPSVVMYSIGNEVTEPAQEKGIETAKSLVNCFHELDGTRPVTAGINITLLYMAQMAEAAKKKADSSETETEAQMPQMEKMDSTAYNRMMSEAGERMNMAAATEEADRISTPVLNLLDIAGYNYASSRYRAEGEKHPGRMIAGTETFAADLPVNWEMVKSYPYLIGDFMWTAWDYLGEVGIGAWTYEQKDGDFEKKYPWLLADTGAFDILGNETAQAGLAAIVWGARNTPYIAVKPVNHDENSLIRAIWRGTNALPYWSYRGCEGRPAEIEVYSRAYGVELFLNDRIIGKKQTQNCRAIFRTAYEEGILKAVSYDEKGDYIAESTLYSADRNLHIGIIPEETLPEPDELLFVDIEILGANGQTECNRDEKLKVTVEGGRLLGFGSACPRTTESYLEGSYTTYYGKSLAVIRCLDRKLTISVQGQTLPDARLVMSRN
ncbi:MAG: DUF4982 domain-containing protein [Butyrivibrio sp.]|nr:DUF4982 domain-containing protein [Butyrivibrio sp.]